MWVPLAGCFARRGSHPNLLEESWQSKASFRYSSTAKKPTGCGVVSLHSQRSASACKGSPGPWPWECLRWKGAARRTARDSHWARTARFSLSRHRAFDVAAIRTLSVRSGSLAPFAPWEGKTRNSSSRALPGLPAARGARCCCSCDRASDTAFSSVGRLLATVFGKVTGASSNTSERACQWLSPSLGTSGRPEKLPSSPPIAAVLP
jgi:hypothetical protein